MSDGDSGRREPHAATAETTADMEAEALAPVIAAVRAQVDDRPDQITAFGRAVFRRATLEGLRSLDHQRVASWLVDAFRFVDSRASGELALRVFNASEAAHGWTSAGTVVEVNLEDGPFLHSTVTEELARKELVTTTVFHPILGVRRGPDGRLEEILPARRAESRESFIHIELAERLDDLGIEELRTALERVISDSRAATRDFPAMQERVRLAIDRIQEEAPGGYPPEEITEAVDFLRWLLDDHFILLGCREYELVQSDGERAAVVRAGSGLGILADDEASTYARPVPLSTVPLPLRDRMEGGPLLTVSRTNRPSTVHRQVRMIYVGVKRVAPDGTVAGESRFLGLFAQKAYAEPASSIPVLRRKLVQILEREDIVDHSYDERAIRALFEAFPKHELFEVEADDLRRTLVQLLEHQKQQDVRLLMRTDPYGRGVSVLVAVPRERFNAAIRERVQDMLAERFGATAVDYHLSITERGQALLHFLLHVDERVGAVPIIDRDVLEREIAALTRIWDDRLEEALVEAHGEASGRRLATRWRGVFPASYQAVTHPLVAVLDIGHLEALLAEARAPWDPETPPVRMVLNAPAEPTGLLRFKLLKTGEGVELSGFVPVLESLGFVVVEEVPHRLTTVEVHIHDFGVRPAPGMHVDVDSDGDRIAAAAVAAFRGRTEIDSLNRLVARAGLGWEDVAVLRAYRRYRLQVGTSFTEAYQNDALVEHAEVARALVGLFVARLSPDRDEADVEPAREAVATALDRVERLDQDRILRGFLGMIEATLRTNRWADSGGARGSGALSLKFDSALVPDVPRPVPHVELFVYSPDVEGVHLRGGPVARGGIRWSDRIEDFRTEVLGLMKAQMVKNALIVPTGAKGGFVLRRAPADPEAVREDVLRQYETYIRGLLDITDNVVDGRCVTPPGVRRADGDDPYLVVAADRGTATFSDVANAISAGYGFWLDDAFASGGSRGYDHKAMGITARGTWVAVQRHFRELGIDVQTEPITVVGIGDMSGDVFGNGMLRSEAIRLVAAFDHRDVFIDPDPDPAASFAERRRLFGVPRSSWQAYDRSVISSGGGVWSRSVKVIELSAEARRLLHLEVERISPPELVKAILHAPVDLLFAGGIGTFVKASAESHAEVGDRANDAIRADADELRCRVVGEGGNLAMTQRARIQYARRGGRCNTDAIDNAAGVDTSDREVNLKILLRLAQDAGRLDPRQRDGFLRGLTDDVAAQVLRDCYLQTWILSQELTESVAGMDSYEQLMVDLDESGRLLRDVEMLPSTADMRSRQEAGAGLTRPELAVLLGYAKTDLRGRLLLSDLPDQPYLDTALRSYFPEAAIARFGDLVHSHRLRRELVSTVVANDLVNRMGITYVSRTAHELGCMAYEVAAAYWIAREVVDAEARWREIERLDGLVLPDLQLQLKAEVDRLIDTFTRSYLRQGVMDIDDVVRRDRPAFEELEKTIAELGTTSRRAARRGRARHYADLGIDPVLAEQVVGLGDLGPTPDIAAVARATDHPVRHVADVFLRLSEALPLDRLHARLRDIDPVGSWERWQHRGLVDELRQLRRLGAEQILLRYGELEPADAVERFLADRTSGAERVVTVMRLFEREPSVTLNHVAVAVRALRAVVA